MPGLSDEEKENIVISIIKHFENPEPISSPTKGGRKYSGKYRTRSSSSKDNRKDLSDKENNHHSRSPTPIDHVNGTKSGEKNLQSEITKSHENGDN